MLAGRETIRDAIVLAVAVLCTVRIGAVEAADFDWGRFKGKGVTVRMIDQKRVWSTLVSGWLPEFEGLTGIKVQLEVLPQEQYNQRIGVEAASGAGQIDIFTTLPGQEGIKLFRAGFVTPVDEADSPGRVHAAALQLTELLGGGGPRILRATPHRGCDL